MTAPTHRRPRLESLTGLRFVAALGVFGWHYFLVHQHEPPFQGHYGLFHAQAGWVGFFFMLSGFVLAWTHRPGERRADFWRKRAARILPAYLLVWLAMVVVHHLIGPPLDAAQLVASLLLVQSWVPSSHIFYAVDTVFWSLAVEALFYAVFPFLIGSLTRLAARGRRVLLAAAVLAPTAIAWAAGAVQDDKLQAWLVVHFPPSRLPEFVAGVLLGLEVRSWRRQRLPLWVGLAVAAGGYALDTWQGLGRFGWVAAPLPFYLTLIAAAASTDAAGRRSFLRHPWLVTLGAWSYAFYLVHMPIRNQSHPLGAVLGLDTATWGGSLALVALTLALAVAAAWAVSAAVAPVEQWIRQASPRLAPRPAGPSAQGPAQEGQLEEQQVLRHRLLGGHVGDPGQRQHLVRATGFEQRLR